METTAIAPKREELPPDETADLIVRTIRDHADSLLRVARKYSICADDAHDAYQRAMEIFMRRAATLDPQTTAAWLRTVAKHEAIAVRAARLRLLGSDDADAESREAVHEPGPEERALSFEMVSRSAEALQRLKPQEVRALWLRAAGHSYAQIAESTGWTHTKINRCLAEGRKSFMARYASIESGEECDRWAPVVSAIIDGEATRAQMRDARPHLRNCLACRAVMRDADSQRASFAALFPGGVAAGEATAEARVEAGGFIARLYDALAGALHERATASMVKFQAVLDFASTGKVAAVAASAAAFAGGGVAAVDKATGSRDERPHQAVVHRAAEAADLAARVTARKQATVKPTVAKRRTASRRQTVRREFGSSSSGRRVEREFGTRTTSPRPAAREFRPATASSTATTAALPTAPPKPSQVVEEFGGS